MVTGEIIPEFHEFTIWLPINISGDKLRSQEAIFFKLAIVLKKSEDSKLKKRLTKRTLGKVLIFWMYRQFGKAF